MKCHETQKKAISKIEEIEILKELASKQSYLLDALGEKGIERMISNIRDDFPIIDGVAVGVSEYHRAMSQFQAANEVIRDYEDTILNIVVEPTTNEKLRLIDVVAERFSGEQVLKKKLERGVELDKKESEFLLKMMDKK